MFYAPTKHSTERLRFEIIDQIVFKIELIFFLPWCWRVGDV